MKHHIPRATSCSRAWMDNGGPLCIAFGGLRVDDAIEEAPLGVVGPGAIAAANRCRQGSRRTTDQVRDVLSRDLEAVALCRRPGFPATAEAADPANRLVASELEAPEQGARPWRRSRAVLPRMMRVHLLPLPFGLARRPGVEPCEPVRSAPTTDADVGKKRIVRTLIREVVADIDDVASRSFSLSTGWVAPTASCACRSAGADSATAPLPILSAVSTGADRQRRSDCRPSTATASKDATAIVGTPRARATSTVPELTTSLCSGFG